MEKVEHIQGPNPEPYKVKLERGQKGTYAWEISVQGANSAEIIEKIQAVDLMLRRAYLPVEPERLQPDKEA
jgi:hypothetical protein